MPVPDLVYRIKKERKRTDGSDFQNSFDLILYIHLGKSPQITYVKRRQNMEHDWTNFLSYAFKVDQSDFYCWFSQVTTAPGLPLMRDGIRSASLPSSELRSTTVFN